MRMSKRRQEMGEEKWAEYQKERNCRKAADYKKSEKGKKNSLKVTQWRRRTKQKLIEYKGGKCEICGYNKNVPGAYDFHHTDPSQKDFGISAKGYIRSLERLKREVDKCILVCRNCHAEIHQNLLDEKFQENYSELL